MLAVKNWKAAVVYFGAG